MVGIDIIDIGRFERFYEKFGEKALKRFLSDKEIALSNLKIDTLAGFFASKEAISKALGTGIGDKVGFFDIKLYKDSKNAPYFTLPKKIVLEYGIKETSLSISHEKSYAVAVAVIETNSTSQKNLYH